MQWDQNRGVTETMSTDCMAIHMQIGLEVSQAGKVHQVDALVWGLL